ncbi:MAG: hypothetical protein LBO74_12745 [Candidatus Symbiothrix sp.]|jgi:hypothetical protein|nr:hypothetical protein [Candidatus Symbiothrix sp.]
MKEYKDLPEKEPDIVSDVAVAYEVAYEATRSLESYFDPITIEDMDDNIPLDANGNPIGTPWEEVIERMYDNLSKHYGVDLRTL